jgi:hypothetical protein
VDEARVILGWAPGGDAPFVIEAFTSHGVLNLQVLREELPSEEWFTRFLLIEKHVLLILQAWH